MLLALYRALPKSMRRRLVRIFSPSRRIKIVRFLSRERYLAKLRERIVQHKFASRNARRLRDGQYRASYDHGDLVLARVRDDASSLQVSRDNRRLVTRVLDQLLVPYFLVDGMSPLRAVVGVPDKYKASVLTALHDSLLDEVAYVRVATRRSRAMLTEKQRWTNHAATAEALQIFVPVCDPCGWMVLGRSFSCEVEFWTEDTERPDLLVAPRGNRVTSHVRADEPAVVASEHLFTRLVAPFEADQDQVSTTPEFAATHVDDVTFPIDAVYTWVDGSDPGWQQRKQKALAEFGSCAEFNEFAANASRFINRDELRYSLRSLYQYAPWIRHIYLVTDDQVPSWLEIENPKITVVSHTEIFGDTGALPTFNSHAIESRLHRIPGLAEHFLYLNDDVFLGRPLTPQHFFHSNGLGRFFLSKAQVEAGPPTVEDPPVLAAGKNNRALIERARAVTLTQKLKHVPHAQQLSVLCELEHEFPDEFAATARHQFRHPDDISIPSALQHYWAYVTGRAVPGSIRYVYSDLADPATPVRLSKLLRHRDFDTFCLNDHDSDELSLAEQAEMLADFLARYFPMRSPLERGPSNITGMGMEKLSAETNVPA